MSALLAWQKAQKEIKDKIGSTTYETWFSSIQVTEKTEALLTIEAPDEFFKNWLIEHYATFIHEALNKNSSHEILVDFDVNPDILKKEAQTKFVEFTKSFQTPDVLSSNLNPRFSFDHFVVGSSNRFAHAACLAVAESPAKAYNPLFVYGGVGLGKTHLMQAIANKIRTTNPQAKFCYITSEKFTNELIDAIRHHSTAAFRQRYRNVDVLLIDDIHFIAGKESTQEEFFHTFNTLHNDRKQIVISSDRPPKEIANLEERLSSRFAWGLIVDIQPPDFETRVAILKKKMEHEPVKVPEDVILFIAQEIKRNIRELEGALVRVIAYSLLEEKPISLETAKIILKDMVKETTKLINIEMIQRVVAQHFHVTVADFKTKRRSKNLVLPRQVAMYLSRQMTDLSLPEIGVAFGGKDHTTVLYALRKIEEELSVNQNLKNIVKKVSEEIHR